MNKLLVGAADFTDTLLDSTKQPFLLIDDGPIADAFVERFPRAKLFDPAQHSFNPLRDIDYKRARDFAQTVYTASPEGKDTLTVRNGKRALARLLLTTERLDRMQSDDEKDGDALAAVEDLLFSPVLRQVLCRPTNFSFKGSVIARIDRAELGDQDALVLALLLIGQHKGQIVVPDFGFYGRPLHMSLIRQNRLTAGLNTFAEIDDKKLRQALELIPEKQGAQCTYDDAVVLAQYAGLIPGQVNHTEFVQSLTVPPATV
jgi:hypothetical protein